MNWVLFWAGAAVLVAALAGAVPAVTWYLDRRKEKASTAEFSIEGAEWVSDVGWSYEELLRHLLSLDRAALPGLTDSSSGNEFTKAPVFEKSPETWSLVVSRDSLIAGYWSVFSLSDKLIKRLERGVMYDKEITEADVHNITEQREHNLYFEMFGVHPGFRWAQKAILKLLRQSLKEFAQELNNNNIKIKAIYANGFTPDGERLCHAFGLEPLIPSVQSGDVYKTSGLAVPLERLENPSRWSRFRRLGLR